MEWLNRTHYKLLDCLDAYTIAVISASPNHLALEVVIVAPIFNDLPATIVEVAKQQGYDNANPKDCITGITYKSHIQLVRKNTLY